MIVRILLIFLIIFTSLGSPRSYAEPIQCPNAKDLIEVPIEDVNKVLESLRVLVPITYEVGEFPEYYSKWDVVTIKPFPLTVGQRGEQDYYYIATNFCGKAVADRSWLVLLHFPRIKTASGNEGQIFIGKKKDSGWFVWHKYQ